jgi:hypothetical protein
MARKSSGRHFRRWDEFSADEIRLVDRLFGPGECPLLQAKLFIRLHGVRKRRRVEAGYVLEDLYPDLRMFTEGTYDRIINWPKYDARLRQLQRSLNNRLTRSKIPLRVMRKANHLWLAPASDPKPRYTTDWRPRPKTMGLDKCESFLRRILHQDAKAHIVHREWKRLGGRRWTLRQAADKLKIHHVRAGFGKGGAWYWRLPKS